MLRWLALPLVVVFSACGPSVPAKSPIDRFKERTLARAAFELDCPADKLTVVDLSPNNAALTVGVSGCEKKLVYVQQEDYHAGTVWVLNSEQTRKP